MTPVTAEAFIDDVDPNDTYMAIRLTVNDSNSGVTEIDLTPSQVVDLLHQLGTALREVSQLGA